MIETIRRRVMHKDLELCPCSSRNVLKMKHVWPWSTAWKPCHSQAMPIVFHAACGPKRSKLAWTGRLCPKSGNNSTLLSIWTIEKQLQRQLQDQQSKKEVKGVWKIVIETLTILERWKSNAFYLFRSICNLTDTCIFNSHLYFSSLY